MNSYKKITIINQSSGYLTVDMVNVFTELYDEVVLITGEIIYNNSILDKKVKVVNKIKYKRNKAFSRIFTWLIFQIQIFFFILFKINNGKLFFVTNPPISIFLGMS